MLNKDNERELAYVVKINEIKPIEGADRVEIAVVNGWRIMVRKGQFQPGDLAIYFEIYSKVPEKEPFMFLESKHFKVKTQKYFKGTVISQGLLMAAEDFGWELCKNIPSPASGEVLTYIWTDTGSLNEGDFLTERLGVTYEVAEDNARKAKSVDKYKKMAQRNNKLFSHQPFRWLMRRDWGKKLLFVFFGKQKDKKTGWPEWVAKTDEERVQNMPWILEDKSEWIATEKIDGTSTTFTMKRGKKKGQYDFYVCSRNVVFDTPEKGCYYDTNVYFEMALKYKVEDALRQILEDNPSFDWVTLQGETYGAGIQKRDYSLKEHNFMGFNFITSETGRWDSCVAEKLMLKYGIPWVPIIDKHFILPGTVEELLAIATDASVIDGGMREGLVFRSQDGARSFKAVSNEFLMKYHA